MDLGKVLRPQYRNLVTLDRQTIIRNAVLAQLNLI